MDLPNNIFLIAHDCIGILQLALQSIWYICYFVDETVSLCEYLYKHILL